MKKPRLIELNPNHLKILRESLLAVSPQEGCAILIGESHPVKKIPKEELLTIELIWPCCNIWVPGIFNLLESPSQSNQSHQIEFSRDNRFTIDPREQIHAQKWARSHKLTVLGSAHSHPSGAAIPSSIDMSWCFHPGLMLILDKSGEIQAWWMDENRFFHQINLSD